MMGSSRLASSGLCVMVMDHPRIVWVPRPKYLPAATRLSAATVVFPTTTFAEKDGSFINHAGRVQRIYQAIETGPGWLRDGDIFTRLLNAIDGGERRFDAEAMWEPIGRTHPRFAGISLETLGASGTMLEGGIEQRPGYR